jgi:hypothetical protein
LRWTLFWMFRQWLHAGLWWRERSCRLLGEVPATNSPEHGRYSVLSEQVRRLALLCDAVVAISCIGVIIKDRRGSAIVRLRRSGNILESPRLTASVVLCSQEIESSQYVVSERLPIIVPRKFLYPLMKDIQDFPAALISLTDSGKRWNCADPGSTFHSGGFRRSSSRARCPVR